MAYEIPLRSLQHICTAKLLVLHNLSSETDLTNKHKQRRTAGLTLGTTQHDGILSPVQLDLNASNEDTSAAGKTPLARDLLEAEDTLFVRTRRAGECALS
jgi:hypothetical protein